MKHLFFSWCVLLSALSWAYVPQDVEKRVEGSSWHSLFRRELKKQKQQENQSPAYEILEDASEEDPVRGETLKIRLKNGLVAYLVSDPTFSESAAALSVRAGTWDDPKEFPGMAHFVEHLLFLGTKAYPSEMEYSQYVQERGGDSNAATFCDRTVYGFSIPHKGFEGALDRLSHFFVDPLFTTSAIEREVHAVDHEFEDAIEDDSIRAWRVLKETGSSTHPNRRFSCGNLSSLKGISSQDVRAWYQEHYQPEQMRLAVFSSLPLQKLARLVSRCFSKIPSEREVLQGGDLQDETLTSDQQRGHLIYITPSFKNRSLLLIWEVPKQLSNDSGSMELLEMAFDHPGENSLDFQLKEKGLITELHAEYVQLEASHALFMFELSLTEKGVEQSELVIEKCFAALHRIAELDVPNYLFEHAAHLQRGQLEDLYREPLFTGVMEVAGELLDEEISTYPQKKYSLSFSSLESIKALLGYFRPHNAVYMMIASPEETGVRPTAMERWMGTKYIVREIPEDRLALWDNIEADTSIGWIPIEYCEEIEEDEESPEEDPSASILVVDTPLANIHLIQSTSSEDRIHALFDMSLHVGGAHIATAASLRLIGLGLEEKLQKMNWPKELDWSLEIKEGKIHVFLSSSLERAAELFASFFSVLKELHFDRQDFERFKQESIHQYQGDPEPLEYAHSLQQSLFGLHTEMEVYQYIPLLSYEDFADFQSQYLDTLHIEGALLGNLDPQVAVSLWQKVEHGLGSKVCSEEPKQARLALPDLPCSHYLLQKTHRKGNALLLMIDAGSSSLDNWAVQKTLSSLLAQEFFEELRTRQQVAYKLYNWQEQFLGNIYQCFALQSSDYHPLDLLQRVELFLEKLVEKSNALITEKRFSVVQNALIGKLEHQIEEEESEALVKSKINLSRVTYEQILQSMQETFGKENHRRMALLIAGDGEKRDWDEAALQIPYLPIEKESLCR